MSELNASAIELFIEAVKNGADEAAAAFARTFDETITIRPGPGGPVKVETLVQKVRGKGLVLVLWVGGQGVSILIPSSTGLVPEWCAHPDVTEKSKLATFAQEWGMNLLPEDFFPEDFKAALLGDMAQGLVRGSLASDSGYLEIHLSKPQDESTPGTPIPVYLAWPLDEPDRILEEPAAEDNEPIPGPPTFGNEAPTFAGTGAPGFSDPFASQPFGMPGFGNDGFDGIQQKRQSLDDLPGYSRSVLKVRIPVAAVLARARKPIKSILELGVGSIIQFDKSSDEPLDVEVGQSVTIATAEAVKVGDKFGIRIHSILLPEERFRRVEVRREGEYRVKHDSPQIIGKAPIKSLDSGER